MPTPSRSKTVWNFLDIPAGASKAEIRKGYKRFVLKEHPDMGGKDDPASVERFAMITEMYRDIMKSDEDKFWLESFDARVTAIVMEREKRWAKKRRLNREMRKYRERKQREAEAAAAAAAATAAAVAPPGVVEAAPACEAEPEQEGFRPDQIIVVVILGFAALLVLAFLAIALSVAGQAK